MTIIEAASVSRRCPDIAVTTRVLLIRHGQPESHSDEGVPLRMSGWTDVPLSARGHAQAARLAAHLAAERTAIDALYASPLRRAASTAEAISHALSLPLELVVGLKEINCGTVDGLPIEEVREKYPQLWRENLRQQNAVFRWPCGESYREFRARCVAAFQAIALRHERQRVAVVTHAGVISQIFGMLNGASAAQWECFRPGMTSTSEVEWDGALGRVLSFDARSHLQA